MGSDGICLIEITSIMEFQSTLPHGERPTVLSPLWSRWYFNPRSRMGSDFVSSVTRVYLHVFQSTLPHGERLTPILHSYGSYYFNPRSRMGSDDGPQDRGRRQRISIHAPAWGATYGIGVGDDVYVFQSTLPHGERHAHITKARQARYFNPRSRMGSDQL